MRTIFYVAIGLIILCAIWLIYLHYDVRNFEKNIAQTSIPVVEKHKPVVDNSPAEDDGAIETDIDNNFEDSINLDTEAPDNETVTEYLDIHNSVVDKLLNTDTDIEFSVDSFMLDENYDEPHTETRVKGACGEYCEKVDFENLTSDERLELWRNGLVKKFGNIPQVDLFIDYMGLSHGSGSVSQEQALEHVRAVATLFPNEANLKHLQEMELRVKSRE